MAPARGELWLAAPQTLQVLHSDGGGARQPLPAELKTPLGSSWKLFVYLYLAEQENRPPDYRCEGRSAEEAFCCAPGNSIGAESALARSCGLYFEPRRLGIGAADWRRFWQRQVPHLPWLARLDTMRPQTQVPVSQLLAAVQSAPPAAALQAQAALLGVTLDGRGAGAVRHFGSGLRVKTWTWDRPDRPQEKMGGFLGWLADGSPVWAASAGASTALFRDWSAVIAPHLERPAAGDMGRSCVQVRLFARYPLRAVDDEHGRRAAAGVLRGRHRLQFERGTRLDVDSAGELELSYRHGRPQLAARLELNEYVARVLDREAAAQPMQAARALAVAARSYLLQNADHADGCYRIDDSSATQRVAPRPATLASRAVARWTDGLILVGQPVRYHRDQKRPGTLAWTAAVRAADEGADFTSILSASFGSARLASMYAPDASPCQPLPEALGWLRRQERGWEARLQAEDGYERPHDYAVCHLPSGRPQVDTQRRRIYVRGLRTEEDRLSLTHEWLHLAFAWHPRGRDELYIENWARRLNGLADFDREEYR